MSHKDSFGCSVRCLHTNDSVALAAYEIIIEDQHDSIELRKSVERIG